MVAAIVGPRRQQQMVRTGSSYLSHSAPILFFGLGLEKQADRLEIRWPDRTEEVLEGLEAGFRYWIEQGRGMVKRRAFVQRP